MPATYISSWVREREKFPCHFVRLDELPPGAAHGLSVVQVPEPILRPGIRFSHLGATAHRPLELAGSGGALTDRAPKV
jgi:hypothetical protein